MKENSIIPCLGYKDAPAAIDWLCKVFQFEKHQLYLDDNGLVAHAELKLGNAMIMLGSQQRDSPFTKLITNPSETSGLETQSPYMVINNIDAHYARAKEFGAKIAIDLKEEHGGKNYSCYDPEGHLWNFGSYDPFNPTNVDAARELEEVEQQWNKAIETNIMEEIEPFMTDDWVIISTEGKINTKKSFLAAVQRGDLYHENMAFETKQIQVHGNCGTVTQLGTSAGMFKGHPFSYYEWSASTFIKRGGKWQCIFTMLTPANKD